MFTYAAHIEDLKAEILDRNLIMIMTDPVGIITDVSKGFEILSGYAKDELVGLTHRIFGHPDTPKEIFIHLWDTITQGDPWYGEIKNRNKCGHEYWSKICIEPLQKDNTILGYIGIYTNITEHKALIRQAATDPLTGIYNRSKLNLLLTHKVEQAYRDHTTFSILFIDLDHFKMINDQFGHLEGDRILIEFTSLTRDTLRNSDLFCRWGGEEFIIVLDKADLKIAYSIAEKLRQRVENHPFGLNTTLTLSIGISQYDPNTSIDDTIKLADTAMYKAKYQGRNQTVLAHSSTYTILHYGFSYDPINKTINRPNDTSVQLSKKEYLLLELLLNKKRLIVPYDTIETIVWQETLMSMDALRTLIRGIRKKTYPKIISNVNGIGYKIDL
ncbi:diguanylate cyclase [Sulfuricurvum sp.]|uniref:diguanylate cyclase n=1 Tax=Sulfuricurvum sp. TaxID=2025608 RepID=UPI003BB7965E